jgi:hypothetical protein
VERGRGAEQGEGQGDRAIDARMKHASEVCGFHSSTFTKNH